MEQAVVFKTDFSCLRNGNGVIYGNGNGVDIVSLTEKNKSLVGGLGIRRAGNQLKVKNKDLTPRTPRSI